MKKILLLVVFCLLASGVWADVAYINTSTSGNNSTPVDTKATASLSVTTGNFIAVNIYYSNATSTVTSVTDTAGNTYYHVTGAPQQNTVTSDFWYAYNITGNASNVVTVTLSATAPWFGVDQVQFSGVKKISDPLNAYSKFVDATSPGTGSITTTATNTVVMGTDNQSSGNSTTWGGSFVNGAVAYLINAPTGVNNVSITWSGGGNVNVVLAAFEQETSTATINNAVINNATIR